MHLGLIGGTGPAATLKYYSKLCATFAAHGQPMRATIAHMDIGESQQRAGHPEEQVRAVSARIGDLKAAGADVAVLTAISGHAILGDLEPVSPLPVFSVLPPLREHAAREGLRRVGIIGSSIAMDTRAMGAYSEIETVIPQDPDLRAEISRTYFEMAIARTCTEAQRDLFVTAGRALTKEAGAEAVFLGGTDLCLAFDEIDPGFRVIDAIDVHVAALVAKALQ